MISVNRSMGFTFLRCLPSNVMHIIVCIGLLALLASCGEPAPNTASTPSPLLSADPDRLWILARVSKVGNGRVCKDHYLQPEDPRYQGLADTCDIWSRHYADYLALNGFPTIEHLHLQESVYWEWYLAKRQEISGCKKALGNLPMGLRDADKRRDHQYKKNQCDPYEHATNNKGILPNELGVRHR